MTSNKHLKTPIALAFAFAGLSFNTLASTTLNADLTVPNGIINASEQNTPYETADKAFDNDQYSKWLAFSPTAWLSYELNEAKVITGYTLTSANDAPSRDPQNWQLQGSNDGINWQTIDDQVSQSFSSRYQSKQYSVSSNQDYKHIRLNISANHGASIVQLAEVELFGKSSDNNNGTTLPINQSLNLSRGQWQHFGPFNVAGKVNASTSGSGDADLYINLGTPATTQSYTCQSITPTATESCEGSGQNLYVSVYGYSQTNVNINITEQGNTDPNDGLWKKPVVDFVDVNPETTGSQLFKRIIADPAGHMAQRCVDVAKILYKDPIESERFRKLRFELRAKDHWGKDFVAYKMGQDGSGEMTIVVSTAHLERLYREGGNSDSAISDEIDGILFHEVTHGYNNSPLTHDNYGDGQAYWAFTEGLADAVRIGAGFHKTRTPSTLDPRKWLTGYEGTGFFLHYVKTHLDNDFIYKFNKSAKGMGNYTWSFDASFRQILGRGVEDVWNEYANFINSGGQLQY